MHPIPTNSSSLGRLSKNGAGSTSAAERAKPIELSPQRVLCHVLWLRVEKRAKRERKTFSCGPCQADTFSVLTDSLFFQSKNNIKKLQSTDLCVHNIVSTVAGSIIDKVSALIGGYVHKSPVCRLLTCLNEWKLHPGTSHFCQTALTETILLRSLETIIC